MQARLAATQASLAQMRASSASIQTKELACRRLASMPENELACRRVRAYRIFSSPEQPPQPSLLLGADTSDLAHDRGEVTSQSSHVLESWNSQIDRFGHSLPEIGNHHVRLRAQRL